MVQEFEEVLFGDINSFLEFESRMKKEEAFIGGEAEGFSVLSQPSSADSFRLTSEVSESDTSPNTISKKIQSTTRTRQRRQVRPEQRNFGDLLKKLSSARDYKSKRTIKNNIASRRYRSRKSSKLMKLKRKDRKLQKINFKLSGKYENLKKVNRLLASWINPVNINRTY